MDSRVRYWTSLAEYDLETAGAVLRTARHLYVDFMCHQAVDKMLKAAWQAKHADRLPPANAQPRAFGL
jgi:HEPN domain-containing protein